MKKILIACCLISLGINVGSATETCTESYSQSYSVGQRVSQGFYKNGSNWIRVYEDWVRISVGGEMVESGFTVENDPFGNCILKLEIGGCITIYSGGRSLYYDGITFERTV